MKSYWNVRLKRIRTLKSLASNFLDLETFQIWIFSLRIEKYSFEITTYIRRESSFQSCDFKKTSHMKRNWKAQDFTIWDFINETAKIATIEKWCIKLWIVILEFLQFILVLGKILLWKLFLNVSLLNIPFAPFKKELFSVLFAIFLFYSKLYFHT